MSHKPPKQTIPASPRELSSQSNHEREDTNFNLNKNKNFDSKPKHPSKIFEDTIMVLILLSTMCLAIDNPLYNPELLIVKVMSRCYFDAPRAFFHARIVICENGDFSADQR